VIPRGLVSAPGTKLIYVGNLLPFPGGGAVLGGQLLDELARRGIAVRALAPITPGDADPVSGSSAAAPASFPAALRGQTLGTASHAQQ
jgi:hypothetical protein